MSYQDFTYPSVLRKLHLTLEHIDFGTGLPDFVVRSEFVELLAEGMDIATGDLGVCSEKAKSEFIVAPILMELRKAMQRRFSVFSGVNLQVDRGKGLCGACDFILTRGSNQHLREAPILGVIEVKNDCYHDGLGQCIAGMVGAQSRNRKANWVASHVFGAITTGRRWRLLQLHGNVVLEDSREYVAPGVSLLGALAQQVDMALSGSRALLEMSGAGKPQTPNVP